jgi:plasmid stabilization system protein ParE
VIVSDRARLVPAGQVGFLAQKNPDAVRRMKNDLLDAIRSLGEIPERYPFLDAEFTPRNKYHKVFASKWYLVLYQIKDQKVYVD